MFPSTARRPRRAPDGERGAVLVEYALLVALIAVVCIAALSGLTSASRGDYSRTGSRVGTLPSASR